MSNEIENITNWFDKAKPKPTIEDACVQIGCHFEEVAEMAAVTGDSDLLFELKSSSKEFKSKNDACIIDIESLSRGDKAELLDALCDQIVTAIGVAHMLGMDIQGALNEVNDSNWSKFDEYGYPIFNEQGKIAKGPSYFAPDLKKFV